MSTLKVNNLEDLGADAVVTDGVIESSALPAGSILQVVQTVKTNTFSASVGAGSVSGDVTGLTVSITPSSSSSKILIQGQISTGISTTYLAGVQLFRDGSLSDYVGDAAGSRTRVTAMGDTASTRAIAAVPFTYLDSPATTSSVTYSVRLYNAVSNTQTLYVNRPNDDSDNSYNPRSASSITLMEVAG